MLLVLNSQQSRGPSHHQALGSALPGMGFELHPMEKVQGPPETMGKDMEDAEWGSKTPNPTYFTAVLLYLLQVILQLENCPTLEILKRRIALLWKVL